MTPRIRCRLARPAIIVAIAVALLLTLPGAAAEADFLRLANGRVLQGEIVAHDDLGITLRRLDTGGVVRLRWNQLFPDDRQRLRRDFGLELPDFEVIVSAIGDRIELKNGNAIEGRITEETVERTTIRFRDPASPDDPPGELGAREIVRADEIQDVFRNVPVNGLALKTPREIYDEVLERQGGEFALDAWGHFLMAQYCKVLELYELGDHHVNEAERLDPSLADTVAALRQLFDDLRAQSAIRERIEEATALVRREMFVEADVILADVLSDDSIADSVRALAMEKAAWLDEEACDAISKQWYRQIQQVATDAARQDPEEEFTLQAARQYAARDMNTAIINAILDELFASVERAEGVLDIVRQDTGATDEEVIDALRGQWTNRMQQLFNGRDKTRYRQLRVTVDLQALEGRESLGGAGFVEEGGDDGPSLAEQMADLRQQYLEAETEEEKAGLMQQMEELAKQAAAGRAASPGNAGGGSGAQLQPNRRGSRQPRSSRSVDDPPAESSGDVWTMDPDSADAANNENGGAVFQGRGSGGRGGGGRGEAQPREEPQGPREPTGQEKWVSASSRERADYLIYLYCERHPAIDRVKERSRSDAVQIWYR